MIFTNEQLSQTPEFKEWITGRVSLIHNTYWDAKEPFPAWIVVHGDMGKWTIDRFFIGGNKLQVSRDYVDLSTDQTFSVLLKDYSRGLD